MKKPYTSVVYEVNMYRCDVGAIVTLSSDRENAYVGPNDGIWNDFEFDDDDD